MASVRLLRQGKKQQKEPGECGKVAESSRGRIPLSVQGEAKQMVSKIRSILLKKLSLAALRKMGVDQD